MKKLLLILFSLMLSFNSYGEWIKVNEDTGDNSYYINFETLKNVDDDYVVWWEMRDLASATNGTLSTKIYYKGDCKSTRTKYLALITYTKKMGTGKSEDVSQGIVSLEDILGWTYPNPDSVTYDNLAIACKYQYKVREGIAKYKSINWGN